MKNINKQLVKLGVIPVSLERIVQQTKSPEFYSRLIDDYQETGSYLKDLQHLGRKIETRVKKSLYSKNAITSTYIEFKDFLSEKIYGRITTTEDLYSQLIYTLNLMRLNFDSMISRCDKQIFNLENYAYYLHSKSLDSHDKINDSKRSLVEMNNLLPILKLQLFLMLLLDSQKFWILLLFQNPLSVFPIKHKMNSINFNF